MNYDILGTGNPAKVAILCPSINQMSELMKHYYHPYLEDLGSQVMVCDLHLSRTKKKTPAAEIKEYIVDLVPHLKAAGIEMLVVTQPDYFKILSKQGKTDATIGDVFDSVGGFKVTYVPNYKRIFHDPEKTTARIMHGFSAVHRWNKGDVTKMGTDIIKMAAYPKTYDEIIDWLQKLLNMDCDLTCDIESFDLKHYDAGIGTITFCWNQHEGIAFEVDNCQTKEENEEVRHALKCFFMKHNKRIIYHNICYDAYVLVYQLFMDHILDQEGMLEGLEVMLKNWECTQLITYLATNSCAGNELGLKIQAQEFAGNYAVEDINDITQIPLPKLLEYNLIDGLSTWYVYNKHYDTMIADQQEYIYVEIFKKAVIDVIQMQLTGLPVNMKKVKALDKQLKKESRRNFKRMEMTKAAKGFMYVIENEAIVEKNKKLKTKVVSRADLGSTKDLTIEFNPNSSTQLQRLMYSKEFLALPILDTTDSGLPSTGADTIEKLLTHKIPNETRIFLEILLEFKASAIILSTFLPAFLKAKLAPDGWHYLFGNFRLGGTLSGRLSSNSPNLQNIPSSSGAPLKKRLAKLIKECFEAPPGWLFVGLDFDSLEDKISAVTTRDPEKIKVYKDGYDGHSIRALAYFPEKMTDIELAPDGGKAYKALINGEDVYFHSEEVIDYMGQELLGKELFALLNK